MHTYDTRPMSRPPAEPDAPATQFVVDAAVLAHGGLTWESEFSDVRFERLLEVALSAAPSGSVRLKFATLDQRPVIHGELRATVKLVCQRCMNPMQYPVQETFELMLVETEAELALVPESHEPWIAHALRLNVLDVIEEQLLLALPLIAKHADERECVMAGMPLVMQPAQVPDEGSATAVTVDGTRQEVQRPFGQLRELLRK